MPQVRAALYLDFDNVFSGLLKLDPAAALQFAEDPGSWLGRLATSLTVEGPRRWLVLRCYMNPSGSVPDPRSAGRRRYFSKFRPYFTGAGFDVVDCPPITHTKNAADIRLVVDAVTALEADPAYEEFVIASGDSDMTPLLVHLRAADRRTTIVSPSDAADAFSAVADQLINGQQVLELVQGDQADLDEGEDARTVARHEAEEGLVDHTAAVDQFRLIVEKEVATARAPINLATLAHRVRAEMGEIVQDSRWFGFGAFAPALEALHLPNLRRSQHLLWDGSRVDAPAENAALDGVAPPDPVARLTALLNVPRLPLESWPAIYDVLAEYAGTPGEFSLTEATRTSRDRLRERGIEANRDAVGFVARGTMFGGAPLYSDPPPSADEIAAAFVGNVLSRAAAADIVLTCNEIEDVRRWLAAPGLDA